jgi:hypothetical protein
MLRRPIEAVGRDASRAGSFHRDLASGYGQDKTHGVESIALPSKPPRSKKSVSGKLFPYTYADSRWQGTSWGRVFHIAAVREF